MSRPRDWSSRPSGCVPNPRPLYTRGRAKSAGNRKGRPSSCVAGLAYRRLVSSTTGPDLLVIGFHALAREEQDEAFERISELRARRDADQSSEVERMICSLRQVAEQIGGEPSVESYRLARFELAERGIEVEEVNRVIRFFGSWREAKEALAMSETTTPRRIEARFRSRRLDKVWRYTEETLGETLRQCVADLGHVPQIAEFDWWRQRQFELARAEGNDHLHLPSANPYRRRWRTWERALLHFGFTPDQVAERLERP